MATATVGIPFFNNEQTLALAVESVLKQNFSDWKLILLDDGSTDSSAAIAAFYQSERIKVLSDGVNRGLVSRLNQLIEMTDTKYFVRMDADDVMVPERLSRQTVYLETHPEIDLVGSSAYIINEDNQITGIRRSAAEVTTRDMVLKKGLFIHPTVTGRTAWFKNHMYREDFKRAEDLELWCRTFPSMKWAVIDDPLLFYRDPAVMKLKDYQNSCRTVKKIIKLYSSEAGLKRRLLWREHMKGAAYQTMFYLKCSHLLQKRRNSRLNPRELDKAAVSWKAGTGRENAVNRKEERS